MVRIAVFGDIPPADLNLLQTAAQQHEAEIVPLEGRPAVQSGDFPAVQGFISYLPSDKESVIRLFATQPIGFGYKIPFYLRIEGRQVPDYFTDLPVCGFFQTPLDPLAAVNMVKAVAYRAGLNTQHEELIGEIIKYRKQKQQLIKMGTGLTSRHDTDSLLTMILTESRDIVCADAASIYVRKKDRPGGVFTDEIVFKISQNDSVDVAQKSKEFTIPIDQNTIAGYVALTGQPLVIDDVYRLDKSVPYTFGRGYYEKEFGYRVKSMLTVPLKNMAGEVVGVVQLMNKKHEKQHKLTSPEQIERYVSSFGLSDQDFILSIASLAAVSIERIQLYESIQQLFEGFLNSSIAAIDERDRVTSGHSRRVMGYAMAFVDAVNGAHDGPFAAETFSEERKRQFKFAALLHDIGKIGVPEAILTKECRMSDGEFGALMERLNYCGALVLASGSREQPWDTIEQLEADRAFLTAVNRSGFLPDADYGRLSAIRAKRFVNLNGERLPVLTDTEWERLAVRRGNLTPSEREMIESHAQSTRRILSKIPWSAELESIPDIACHHHEKLDGSGYPDRLGRENISLESRILAVIDIYEALVAQDRPYKPKIPPEKALAILRSEVAAGHLDGEVVEFFAEKGVGKTFMQ